MAEIAIDIFLLLLHICYLRFECDAIEFNTLICQYQFHYLLNLILICDLPTYFIGHHKCREQWPDDTEDYERAFNLFLDMILLIFPLVLLSTAYFSITKTLWQGMAMERTTRRHTTLNIKQTSKRLLLFQFIF